MPPSLPLDQIIRLADATYRQCAGLPFAAYLLSADGIFLNYNEEGRKLFGLPPEPDFQQKITDFYIHPGDREENLKLLGELPKGEWLSGTTLDLKVRGQDRYVRDYSRAIWNETGTILIGLVSMMIPTTRGDRYHRLFNELPVGIFSFRNKTGLINANPSFLKMHGYESFEEVNRKHPEFFLKNRTILDEMGRKLIREGSINNVYQEHIRKDGSEFIASVSAKAVKSKNGQWIGTEGILEDVTTEAIYFKLVNEVPIGLFHVRINDKGEHILLHCNHRFAQNRGFTQEEMIGQDLRRFHSSIEEFNDFYRKLLEKDQNGQDLVYHTVPLVNGQNEVRRHEIHAKLLKDPNGKVIGRIGAERDVTEFLKTKEKVDELTEDMGELTTDFGKVLHSYSSTLIHSKQTMDAVIRSLVVPGELRGPETIINDVEALEKITSRVSALDSTVEKLLEKNQTVNFIGQDTVAEITRLLQLLKTVDPRQQELQRLAVIRDVTIKVRKIIYRAAAGNFPKELIKDAQRHLREILRLCSLITLQRGVDTVLEMETTVNNLRGFILTKVRPEDPPQEIDLYDVMIGITRTMEEYASHRSVELRLNVRDIRDEYLMGYEEDLVRALLNILHNAIKYSWTRQGPKKAFVSIQGKRDSNWVYLSVENWGVPITQEEIEKGLIFTIGYRGVNSSDRRRPGTGLGLYDARKVVTEKHGGKLIITSEPSLGNAEQDYSHPFVTTVTIQLPRNRERL